jgi:hypothetical protein
MDARCARGRRSALVLVALVGLTAVLATACGPAPGGGPTPPGSGSGALVAYHVSGGFAGIDERLVVSRDGGVVHTAGRSAPQHRRLTADQLTALVDALEASDFAALPPDTVDPRVADAFVYEVTYEGRRVRTSDGAVPGRLAPVIDQLREIAAG